jgi:hypothetical protein
MPVKEEEEEGLKGLRHNNLILRKLYFSGNQIFLNSLLSAKIKLSVCD